MSTWLTVFLVVALVAFFSPLIRLVVQLRRATPRQPVDRELGLTYSVLQPDGRVVAKDLASNDADSIIAWLESIRAGTVIVDDPSSVAGADGGSDVKGTSRITNDLTGWIVGGSAVVLVAFVAVATWPISSNQGIRDAASALVLISGAAVSIERILEVFWNFIDTTAGSFWPLSAIDAKINALVDSITADTSGPIAQLKSAVDNAQKETAWTVDQVAAAKADIDKLSADVAQLRQLAPNSDNAQAITAFAARGLVALGAKYPAIRSDADAAKEAVGAISDFVNSFSDNPGRRIISIYIGALMGLAVAAVIGLDVFAATLGDPSTGAAVATVTGLNFGVAATGIVMGLGSNPTHELIKALQAFKQNQQST